MRLKNNYKIWNIGDKYMIIEQRLDNMNISDVYTLNETSLFIINSVQDKEFDIDDLCKLVYEKYNADKEHIREEIVKFLDRLEELNMLDK